MGVKELTNFISGWRQLQYFNGLKPSKASPAPQLTRGSGDLTFEKHTSLIHQMLWGLRKHVFFMNHHDHHHDNDHHHDHDHHVNLRKVSDTLRLPLSCSASAFSLWTKFIIFSLGTKVSIKSHNFHHRSHSSSLFITLRLCDHHCHGIAQSALPLNPQIKMFSDFVYFQCFPI